jgi:tight adherence protein B
MVASIAALFLLLGGATILAVALGARTRQRALVRRVDLIARPAVRRPAPLGLSAWWKRGLDGLRSLFTFRMRRSWGVSASPIYLAAAGLGAAAAVWTLTLTVVHLPGYASAIGAAGGFLALPRFVLFRQQRRADRQFAELLPDAIDMVVRVVRAGLPVGVAMRTVGQEAEPPLSTVFVKIADQTDIGLPLDQALATTSDAVGNPDFRFFAVAVALQQATGGNLTVTLEALGQIIRKRRAVRLKAGAATAEVRISGIVLGAIPFVVTGLLLMVAPDYLAPLFADPRGNIILGMAVLGLSLAGITMRAMIRNSLMV